MKMRYCFPTLSTYEIIIAIILIGNNVHTFHIILANNIRLLKILISFELQYNDGYFCS